MAHVASQKIEAVKTLVQEFERSPVIGIVGIRGIPAPQFQAMRKKLLGRARLKVSKNNLLRIALKEAAARKKDKLLVKAGDKTPRDVAPVLPRLEIYPLTVGLDLRGAYEAGTVFRRDVLSVDDAKVRADLSVAGRNALNLAVYVGYPSKQTIRPLLSTAFRRALALAMESGFPTKESVKFLLAKAQAQALALASHAPGAMDDATRKKLGSGSGGGPAKGAPEKAEKKEGEASEEEAGAGPRRCAAPVGREEGSEEEGREEGGRGEGQRGRGRGRSRCALRHVGRRATLIPSEEERERERPLARGLGRRAHPLR